MTNPIDEMKITATEQLQAKNIAEHLTKHYPGHLWAVQVYQGIAIIRNVALSGQDAYVLHMDKIDNDGRDVIRAGGEILERFNLGRGHLIENQFRSLKRDYKGVIIHA